MAKKTNLDHTELLVLSLLAQEDMYGYQMIAELARQSDQQPAHRKRTVVRYKYMGMPPAD